MNRKRYFFLVVSLLIGWISDAQGPEVGQKAPEIVMENPAGEEIALSDLQGQLVLIDFWASWCAPCRKENPYLVDAYETYKDSQFKNGEGFAIFSVSLDMKQNAWENAIEKDSLYWDHHVSDLKGWRNVAAQGYEVRGIPANFLIDGEGNIVAKNLRGPALVNQLKKLEKGNMSNFFENLFSTK